MGTIYIAGPINMPKVFERIPFAEEEGIHRRVLPIDMHGQPAFPDMWAAKPEHEVNGWPKGQALHFELRCSACLGRSLESLANFPHFPPGRCATCGAGGRDPYSRRREAIMATRAKYA
jgi:hypothetical protein